MRLPTHIVIDVSDGWVFARDHNGKLFTENTAKHFAAARNNEVEDEFRTYVVAAVTPLRSAEYLAALAQTADTDMIG